jgi:small subunit ribosomal protein S27e
MKKSDGGLPAAARERRRRRRLFSHPKLAFSLRCCPCASACSPISIGSAPSCRERGHQSSRGSLGTRISLSIFARYFFRSGRRRSTFFSFAHRAIFLSLVRNKTQVLSYDIDLLNPPAALEARKHKLKRLVQSPNSYFMDVKCQGCFQITVVFSNSQTVVVCPACSAVLCTPTGGRARLTEGCSFRKKGD